MEKQMTIWDFIPDPDVKHIKPWYIIPCPPMVIGYIGNEENLSLKKRIKTEKQMSIYDFILEPKLSTLKEVKK